jgi:hypothetical protein
MEETKFEISSTIGALTKIFNRDSSPIETKEIFDWNEEVMCAKSPSSSASTTSD